MIRPFLVALLISVCALTVAASAPVASPDSWVGDLSPISASDWNYDRAAHLIERAGFGATPEEIARLAAMTPERAVAMLVDYEAIDASALKPFDASPSPAVAHGPQQPSFCSRLKVTLRHSISLPGTGCSTLKVTGGAAVRVERNVRHDDSQGTV